MKPGRIILIVAVIAMSIFMLAPSKEVDARTRLSPHCAALNNPSMDNLWALTATGGPGSIPTTMYAGETIYVSAGPPVALYPTEINLFINDTVVATAPYPGGSIVYTLQTNTSVWAVGAHTGGTRTASPGTSVAVFPLLEEIWSRFLIQPSAARL